jgi:hypothetical protein
MIPGGQVISSSKTGSGSVSDSDSGWFRQTLEQAPVRRQNVSPSGQVGEPSGTSWTWAQYYKTFFGRDLRIFVLARVFLH